MDKTTLSILGLGSRTTSFYLSELNRLYNEKNGGYSTCPLLLLNTNFNSINSLLPNTSQELDDIIQHYITELEKLDINHIIIPNITLHETIERIKINKNIINPILLTISKIKQNKRNKIVLFGSLHTMKSAYLQAHFKAKNIDVILPSEDHMFFIDKVRKQIYNKTETKDLIDTYHLLLEKYSEKNLVVLSCTELSILKPLDNKNLLDMAQIQIEEAINISN
ncbi:aspartate/glutamate racemase family protein [Lutibacter citreus]|uniref:aspartate/glutamate racemase family protein n=1 Tax=Lutibacter citreus TaxID=2138210 RepID=UPI000DBE24B8|nr:aspartate/glutamate racemase family protein [Lutibacter citreus]